MRISSTVKTRWLLLVAVLIAVGFGIYGVGDASNLGYALAGLLVVVLILWPRSWWRVDVAILRAAGAVSVAVVALVGVNVLVSLVDEHVFQGSGEFRLPILWGMAVALVVVGLVIYWYLRRARYGKGWSAAGAIGLALFVIAGVPVLVGLAADDSEPVPESVRVASQLDLLIVTDGRPHPLPPQLPPNPALSKFDVSYSVGVAEGDGVRWTLVDDGDGDAALGAIAAGRTAAGAEEVPIARTGADTALLLVVDGTPAVTASPADLPEAPRRRGEIKRWNRIAAGAAPPGTPVAALLQTTDAARLDSWEQFSRLNATVSAQKLLSPTTTDAALRLAVAAPTSQADFALAMAHRPVLLFDEHEPFPWPHSIDALFNEKRVTLCHDRGVGGTGCAEEATVDPRELTSGGTHLQLELRKSKELRKLARDELDAAAARAATTVAPAGPGTPPAGTPPSGVALPSGEGDAPLGVGSTIYVHPVSIEGGGKRMLYLDYWWYLPGNPVDVGAGALCGAGLVIPGVTCQGHQSDWEGLTVVVDRTEAVPKVVAVQYAQHDSVVRYGWRQLRDRWRQSDMPKSLAAVADVASRPLAFVAKGTHASYPEPCRGCGQVAHDFGESSHLGEFGWIGNDTNACGRSSCLQMLPTRAGGCKPALWNAYSGQWGERHCELTFYCDSGSPPTAPGKQARYRNPVDYDLISTPRKRRQEAPAARAPQP